MIKGLYIHIPFCEKICSYCDFCKLVASDEIKADYITALINELQHYREQYQYITSIYIGGGTPSSIKLSLLESLLIAVEANLDLDNVLEYSIEANPNDINDDLLVLLKKHQINRLSIGVQSNSDKLLKLLNRSHQKVDVIKATQLLKKHNFNNYNLDFIYGIPEQSEEELRDDLRFIETIKPPHISYYSLIIEDNTLLKYKIDQKLIKPLDEDLVVSFSDQIIDKLTSIGYDRYEFSNYALKEQQSKHNLLYWNLEEYLGIGLGAASQYAASRFVNQRLISKYIANISAADYSKVEEEFIPEMEYLLMGLRKTAGIDMLEYQKRFNKPVFTMYPSLKQHLENGLLEIENNMLRFSRKGIDLSNQVYLEIL